MWSRRGLVFEARNRAHVVRAARADRAVVTRSSITVIDLGEIAQRAVADRRQQLPGRADIGVAPRGAASRSGNVRDMRARSAVCVSRPISTTWLVTASSTIRLFFASTATWTL
jgi:hypothetical protein